MPHVSPTAHWQGAKVWRVGPVLTEGSLVRHLILLSYDASRKQNTLFLAARPLAMF
jgi:hypothetical protein